MYYYWHPVLKDSLFVSQSFAKVFSVSDRPPAVAFASRTASHQQEADDQRQIGQGAQIILHTKSRPSSARREYAHHCIFTIVSEPNSNGSAHSKNPQNPVVHHRQSAAAAEATKSKGVLLKDSCCVWQWWIFGLSTVVGNAIPHFFQHTFFYAIVSKQMALLCRHPLTSPGANHFLRYQPWEQDSFHVLIVTDL